nr:tigger transposable element-derived protein 4-like [Vanessa tameamea]
MGTAQNSFLLKQASILITGPHPKIENLSNIKLAFLPPNTTSVIQPIDQGIIKTLKVQKMMNDIENAAGSFSVNLLDAIEMITTAWARVTPDTIKKCFLHAGFCKSSVITTIDDDSDDELDIPLAQLTTSSSGTNVADWETYVNIDSQLITTSNLTDNEIVETVVTSPTTQDEENEEEEEDGKEGEILTTEDVLCAVTRLKRYCVFGDGKDTIDIEGVMKIEYTLQLCMLAQKNELKQNQP